MFEYIVIFIVVGFAAWYVGLTLWKESKGNGCSGCKCTSKDSETDELVQIKIIDKK